MSNEGTVKFLVLGVVGTFTLIFIFSIAAGSGGNWSGSKSVAHENGTIVLHTTAIYGLTQMDLDVPTLFHETIAYADAKAHTHNFDLILDFEDVIDAGRAATAFLVLSMLVGPVVIMLHLCIWPIRRGTELAGRLGLPLAVTTSFLLLLAWIIWAALGHTAAKHIAVDQYPEAMPDMTHGWCFEITVTAFVFSLIGVLLTYFLQRMVKDEGGHGTEQYESYNSGTSGTGAGVAYQGHEQL